MTCQGCDRFKGLLLESLVFEDRAQSAMRCYLFTHLTTGGVSDVDQYLALQAGEQKAAEQRNQAYLTLINHWKTHNPGGPQSTVSSEPTLAMK